MARGEETITIDGLVFVWDRAKARANRRKHGVTFEEAATVFADPLARIRLDRSEPHRERRMQILGYSLFGRSLLTVYVEVDNDKAIRIISARKLEAKERRKLEEE